MIRPLGLELVSVIRTHDPLFGPGRVLGGHTEMVGDRHGRTVSIRLEEWSSVVEMDGHCDPFAVTVANGRWGGAHDATPRGVAALLAAITPHPRWVGAEIVGGRGGVVLRRASAPTQSWMHDLWLAERFADAAARHRAAVPAA